MSVRSVRSEMAEPVSPTRTIRFRYPLSTTEDREANANAADAGARSPRSSRSIDRDRERDRPSLDTIRSDLHKANHPGGKSAANEGEKENKVSKRLSQRSAKALEEIKADGVMTTEVWYEELECGICAHVLGASQALVPCGHSFCGPCAWQWIILDKNYTCPHCRTQILAENPLVPNIIVDQIVDRKLNSLQKGTQKEDLLSEREDKVKAWKVLQNELHAKPKRRTKGFDEWFYRFSGTAPESDEVRRRRASRHIHLGAPLESPPVPVTENERPRAARTLSSGGLTLSQLRRLDRGSTDDLTRGGMTGAERFRQAPAESRPLRAVEHSQPASGRWEIPRNTWTYEAGARPGPEYATVTTAAPARMVRPYVDRAYSSPAGRHGPLRSNALAARQARGQRRDTAATGVSETTDSDGE